MPLDFCESRAERARSERRRGSALSLGFARGLFVLILITVLRFGLGLAVLVFLFFVAVLFLFLVALLLVVVFVPLERLVVLEFFLFGFVEFGQIGVFLIFDAFGGSLLVSVVAGGHVVEDGGELLKRADGFSLDKIAGLGLPDLV